MASVLESPRVPAAEPRRTRRRWPWLVAGLVVVALLGVWLTRPRTTSPEDFAAFSQRLDGLRAPGPSFTSYQPATDGTGAVSADGPWVVTGAGTWTSTADPHWWVAVHGWATVVTVDQAEAVCRQATDWLASSATTLGLPAGGSVSQSRCLSSVVSVRDSLGADSDSLSGSGTQTSDGRPRFRTGALVYGGPSPGQVTLVVLADASVANP